MKEQGKLIPEQGKKTKGQGNGQGEQGSLISPRKYDFSIDKIDRREVHLYQLQSLMKCAANGGLEPRVTNAARCQMTALQMLANNLPTKLCFMAN